MRLETFSSPEVRDLPMDQLIVVAPLGAFEQHGAHLPLTTDTDIVTAISRAVEAALPDQVLALPCIWLGHSTAHKHFPGTLDIRQMHYIALIQDLCESLLAMGARKILLLNGHAGNNVPLRAAMREIKTARAGQKGIHLTGGEYWTLAAESI